MGGELRVETECENPVFPNSLPILTCAPTGNGDISWRWVYWEYVQYGSPAWPGYDGA